jgi:hypothetical protein
MSSKPSPTKKKKRQKGNRSDHCDDGIGLCLTVRIGTQPTYVTHVIELNIYKHMQEFVQKTEGMSVFNL